MATSNDVVDLYEVTATTAQLEECFGVTKQYLGQLEKDGGIKKSARNTWKFFETAQQFIDLLKNRKVNQHDSGEGVNLLEVAEQYEKDKGRKMKADADIAEVLADLVTGRVHEGKAVEELWIGQQMSARSRLLSLPSKIAAEMPPEIAARVKEIATDIVHEALIELADYDPQKIAERTDKKRILDPTPTADDAVMETASQVESEPMG